MRSSVVYIASFPMPNPDTYYFWLYYKALEQYGYKLFDTRSQTLDINWLMQHRETVQVLHFHWPAYIYSHKNPYTFAKNLLSFTVVLIKAKRLGYHIVWTVHNLFPHEKNNVLLEYLARFILARLSDLLFVHFKEAKEKIRILFGRNRDVSVIPHGDFSSVFKTDCSRTYARADLNLPLDSFVFLIFGPIRSYKGIEDAIKAFKAIDDPNSILLIAGKPLDKEICESILHNSGHNSRIRPFLRFIEEGEVSKFFNASDVVLLPYKKIFTSGNLFLAMTFNKPVIAPNIGIISEVVDESFGIKYDSTEPAALQDAMIKIRSLNVEAAYHASRAKSSMFTWEDSAAISHKALNQTLHHSSASSDKGFRSS